MGISPAMVIVIPVTPDTVPLVEAFLSLVESQGGCANHHLRFPHDADSSEAAAALAARAAKLALSAAPIRSKKVAVRPDNELMFQACRTVSDAMGAQALMWLEPGALPASQHAFDLVAAAIAQYPHAGVITGIKPDKDIEPTELVVVRTAALSKSPALRKMVLTVDRTWRSVLTLMHQQTVRLPALTLGDAASFFTVVSAVADTKDDEPEKPKRTAKKAAPKPVEDEAPAPPPPAPVVEEKPVQETRHSTVQFS